MTTDFLCNTTKIQEILAINDHLKILLKVVEAFTMSHHDSYGPLQVNDNSNSHMLVAGDSLSRWFEVYTIPNQEASTAANSTWMKYFANFPYTDT